jgi:hypothetical protein
MRANDSIQIKRRRVIDEDMCPADLGKNRLPVNAIASGAAQLGKKSPESPMLHRRMHVETHCKRDDAGDEGRDNDEFRGDSHTRSAA